MTGLNPDTDVIIEIFCIITDGNLKVLDEEGWGVIVHQSKETMDKMVPIPGYIDHSVPEPSKDSVNNTRMNGVRVHMARMDLQMRSYHLK